MRSAGVKRRAKSNIRRRIIKEMSLFVSSDDLFTSFPNGAIMSVRSHEKIAKELGFSLEVVHHQRNIYWLKGGVK